MRIAIVSDFVDPANWGGAARVVAEEAVELTRMGHDVLVSGASHSGQLLEGIARHEAWVIRNRLTGLIGTRRRTDAALRSWRPEFMILHQPWSAMVALGVDPTIPNCFVFKSSWAGEVEVRGGRFPGIRQSVERRVYDRVGAVDAISDFMLEEFRGRFGHTGKSRVNELGVRTDPGDDMSHAAARTALEHRFGLPDGVGVLCTFRRLVPRTGIVELVEAMSDIPGAVLLICGKGELEGEIRDLVDRAGLGSRVRLLGYVSDEDRSLIYRASDLSIVPSQSLEGFGLSTVESMAAGLPVVVTPVGNNVNVIERTEGGVVAPNGTPAALAAAVRDALGLQWDREALAERVVGQYSWQRHAEMLMEHAR